MTASDPAAGTYCGGPFFDGFACDGFNYWDVSKMDYNSGSATLYLGYVNCDSCTAYGYSVSNPGMKAVDRINWNNDHPGYFINLYNRVVCFYLYGTYAYNQCWGVA